MGKTKYKCIHCNDEYEPITEEEKKEEVINRYCPYCKAVVFGGNKEFASWPPKVGKRELRESKKGYLLNITDKP